jgi:recombination protein RecA
VIVPEYGEQVVEAIDVLAKTGKFSVVVLDSVAALMPKAEMEDDIDKNQVGQQSRMMSKAMRRLNATMTHTKTSLILINQLREKIGIMYGNKYTTPGGLAIRFYSSVRVEFFAKKLKEGDDVIGNEINLKVVKNKVRAPFGTGIVHLIHGQGIDESNEIAEAAVTTGVVGFEGRRYKLGDQEIAVGIADFKQKIKEDNDFRLMLKTKILDTLNSKIAEPVKEVPAETAVEEPVKRRRR